MATNTTYFNLIKPAYEEDADVADLNTNADRIDNALYNNRLRNGINLANIYDASESYAVDDYCVYLQEDGYRLYKCIEATTGAFDPTKWDEAMVMESVETAEDGVDNAFKTMGVMGAKNLNSLPYYHPSGRVNNNVTWTVDSDGILTANGKATNGNSIFSCHSRIKGNATDKIVPNGRYILSGCPSGGSDSTYWVQFDIARDGSAYTLATDYGDGVEIVLNGDDYSNDEVVIQIQCKVRNNYTADNLTFKPMLRLATDNDNTYQPYAQTNKELTENKVDWASENVLGGKNLVIQPYTYGGGTIQQVAVTINDDYSIRLNGTAGNNFWIPLNGVLNSQYTLTLKKGKYRLSCVGFTSGLNSATFLGLIKAGETSPFVSVNGGNDTKDFSLTEDTNVFVGIRINSGEVLSHTLYPMLCFASVKNNEYAPFSLPNKVITERIQCDKTTAGTYTLQATVASNGAVTYEWVSTT